MSLTYILGSICFLVVNIVLTIILAKGFKNKQYIDILFLICLIFTFLGNAILEAHTANVLVSFANIYLGTLSFAKGIKKI